MHVQSSEITTLTVLACRGEHKGRSVAVQNQKATDE